jgi:penicillin-binding protein 1B
MNTATVRLAERVGYSRVVALARQAGLNDGLKATPAIALGAYEATPLEIAGAYTVFANEGTHLEPIFVSEVRSSAGKALFRGQAEQRAVLDPRVAFLMRDMLEEVLRSGTAAGVRARGFTAPAAGKTGTSRDGWFAGFTSNLICVVWVGFDDNSELNLEGAKSALPIWTEFMKRATQSADVASPFDGAPAGIVTEQIDPETGDVAGPQCPSRRMEYFIAGSEPQVACALHAGGALSERAGERESGGNTESASRK